ncbi:MAG TPA: FG-GAP-like repeat-containing protein [Spirochaetota bacterium]|nr:FG-GAP-like repeat-containing protein [Spirochaetota bacterium]
MRTEKRKINKKIEQLFNDNNYSQPGNSKKKIRIINKYTVFTLLLLLSAAAVYLYITYFYTPRPQHINISKVYSISTYDYVISTPHLTDINSDSRIDLCYADNRGGVHVYDAASKKLIFHYFFKNGITASLFSFDINNDGFAELIATARDGTTAVLNSQGKYLYKSRQNTISEPIYNKGAILSKNNRNYLILTGRQGTVCSIAGSYGLTDWKNTDSKVAGEKILASPLIVKINEDKTKDVLVVSEKGSVSALDGVSGNELWSLSLEETVIACPAYGDFINRHEILITTMNRHAFIISLDKGTVIKKSSIPGSVIASPAAAKFQNNKDEAVICTDNGHVLRINFSQNRKKLFTNKTEINFRASPVLCDINRDKTTDIIAVSGSGHIYLLDGSTLQKLTPVYKLQSEVSATPLIGDVNNDGNLEIIIANENGKIYCLVIKTTPAALFPKGRIQYNQFLGNVENLNNIKYYQ